MIINEKAELAPATHRHAKTCTYCGRVYSRAEWERAELRGRSTFAGTTLEYRQCECGGTMAIEVAP
jgi:hypothetical protein